MVTNGLHSSGVASAKALAGSGYDVIGADFGRLPFNLSSRHVRVHYPILGSNSKELKRTLLEGIARHRPSALLPIGSRFVAAAISGRQEIEVTTALQVPSLEAFLSAFEKPLCMAECRKLGIAHAQVYTLAEARQLLGGAHRSTRLVLKPDFDAGGAQGVRYPSNLEELEEFYGATVLQYGGAMIQEYIPGTVKTMKAVTLLFGEGGRLVAAFTIQKLGQWPREGGVTTLAQSTADEGIVNQMLPFFEKLKWVGAAEVELKYDERDGLDKVIEINPRFPGYVGFALECGLRLPQLAVAEALGEGEARELVFPSYRLGEVYCNPGLLMEAVWSDLSSGIKPDLGLRSAEMIVRPACRGVGSWFGDPGPMVGRVLDRFRRTGESHC